VLRDSRSERAGTPGEWSRRKIRVWRPDVAASRFKLESIAVTRTRRHKEWRGRRVDPPDGALYGTQKVAKTKLAVTD